MATLTKQNHWDLETVIAVDHAIEPQYFASAPEQVAENFERLPSRDVFSEADAQFLYAAIVNSSS